MDMALVDLGRSKSYYRMLQAGLALLSALCIQTDLKAHWKRGDCELGFSLVSGDIEPVSNGVYEGSLLLRPHEAPEGVTRIQYQNFAITSLSNGRWGLKEPELLSPDYATWAEHVVLGGTRSDTGEITGIFRGIEDYQPFERFPNLRPELVARWKGRVIADLAAYYSPDVLNTLEEPKIFQTLFATLLRYSKQNGIDGIYVQTRVQVKELERLGFRIGGQTFNVEGWEGEWTPMVLDLGELSEMHRDPDFVENWPSQTSSNQRLNVGFWRRITKLAFGSD